MKPLTYASHVLPREKHSRRIRVFEYKPCLKPRTSLRGRISSTKAMIYFQKHGCTLRTGGMQHPRVFLPMNQVMGNSQLNNYAVMRRRRPHGPRERDRDHNLRLAMALANS